MSAGNHNPINNGPHVREQLSAYMDGLLAGDEREAVRAHLEQCADCRADYIELRATQKLMQNMPAVAAPRSFALTPEMAGKARRLSFWESIVTPRNAPRLATGSVVAFLLLFIFIASDFAGNNLASVPASTTAMSKSGPGTSADGTTQQPTPTTASVSMYAPGLAGTPQPGSEANNSGAGVGPATAPSDAAPAAAAPTTTTAAAAAATDTTAPADHSQNDAPTEVVSSSASGNPTTTTLDTPTLPQAPDNVTTTYSLTESPSTQAASPSSPPTDNSTVLIAVQVGLLALALALATAAFISWRRA